VPSNETFPYYDNIEEGDDLPAIVKQQIEHFFTHYKDLEPEKWVRVGHWGGKEDAHRIILGAMETAKANKGSSGEDPRPLG
jgi:inorganic pyrophosphatase